LWTTRNMQKLTCYTQDGPHSGSWAPPAYHCSVQLTCLLGVHQSLDCQISRAVSPKQKLKINQLENILNLIGQDLCNSIWLREGPETVRRPSLNIFFGARQADLNWSACVSEHHCLCEAIKAQKKSYSFRFQTTNKGWWWLLRKQSCGVVPAEITDSREHLTTLKTRMCFDRKRILFVFDQLWCRENAVILLSLPAVNCLFQLPTVSSSSDERWWKCRSGRI